MKPFLCGAVNLESTECRVSHDTILSLGSLVVPLLNSGAINHVTVIHRNHGADASLLEARVSFQEGSDRVKIVELKSSGMMKTTTSDSPTEASISGVIPVEGFTVSMIQLENDLHVWNSLHAFVLGQIQIERVHSTHVSYCLDDSRRGSLPVSVSRMPEEMYYYLEHAAAMQSGGLCCSHGVSDVMMKDSSGCYWGAIACLVSIKNVASQKHDTQVQTLSVFNSTPEPIHSKIVQMLSKCAWSRKGGFTFRSNSGALPISITRHGKNEEGSWCLSISRIVLFLYPMPGDDCTVSLQSEKKIASMTVMVRSALNNAIQQMQVNMNTGQPQWAGEQGTEAVTTLVESLTSVLSRADDASHASQNLLLAMKRMRVSSVEDVHTKLREMVIALRTQT